MHLLSVYMGAAQLDVASLNIWTLPSEENKGERTSRKEQCARRLQRNSFPSSLLLSICDLVFVGNSRRLVVMPQCLTYGEIVGHKYCEWDGGT